MHLTFTHVFEAVKQDWFCVASVLEHVISAIKEQLLQVKKRSIVHAQTMHDVIAEGHLWLCLPVIMEREGIYNKSVRFFFQ